MSEHDPFDGDYSGGNSPTVAPAAVAQGETAEAPRSERQFETFSLSYLRRQDKEDLQDMARERGLDATGTRDALIGRIATWQQQGTATL